MTKKSKQVASENGDSLSPVVENKLFDHNENPPRFITKAKIAKDSTLEVEYKFVTPDGIWHNSKESSDGQVHKDLNTAFNALVPHLINIADQKESPVDIGTSKADDYANYLVTGFVITGSGDEEGVMIIGQKLLDGKCLNLITPTCKVGDSYKFVGELFECIDSCKYEAEMYLGGKFAAKQIHMEFPEEVVA